MVSNMFSCFLNINFEAIQSESSLLKQIVKVSDILAFCLDLVINNLICHLFKYLTNLTLN
jgi:hypothetical protein